MVTVSVCCMSIVCLSVCVCVCLSMNIFMEIHVQSLLIFVHVTHGRGSVLLWQRLDDVILAHNPRQPTCSFGLGYKRRVGILVVGHGLAPRTTFRAPQSGHTRPQWAC